MSLAIREVYLGEIPPHPARMAVIKKTTTNAGEDAVCVGVCVCGGVVVVETGGNVN
jgi:hypothetical protein